MPSEPTTFNGFKPDALQFLADLAANNDRNWFKPRKADYERLLKEPMEALCVALADRLDLVAGYQKFAVDGTADSLSGLRAIDDSTLEITLVEPFVSMPADVATNVPATRSPCCTFW